MRWQGRRQSKNVEDRRSLGREVAVGGGLLTLLIMGAAIFFPDLVPVLKLFEGPAAAPARQAAPAKPINDEMGAFIRTVVADNEDVWGQLFPQVFGRRFAPAKLVMFTAQVRSACGIANAGAGPFYCPLDKTVYIDPTFYEELKRRFGAPGDFAQAYVIAHEFGHHIQNQLGISQQVQSLQGKVSQKEYNKASVRLELQADFLAGVWAHHLAKYAGILDEEDIKEAINAAAAIGDDRIQKQTQGYVVADAFTHGSSEQRVRWFMYGLQTGDPKLMDRAFEVDSP
jgi:predicted metalloprotease